MIVNPPKIALPLAVDKAILKTYKTMKSASIYIFIVYIMSISFVSATL